MQVLSHRKPRGLIGKAKVSVINPLGIQTAIKPEIFLKPLFRVTCEN
jgi:hypothetical protein